MSVVIGWLDGGITAGDFTESVARLAAFEVHRGRLTTTMRIRSGPLLAEGRNLLVEKFLEVEAADWLLMVDADMVFPHTVVDRLLTVADPSSAPVVGGLCFGVNDEFGQFPTIYREVDGLPAVWFDYPRDQVVQVDATGAAMLLTHRDVFVKWAQTGPHRWFHRRPIGACDRYPHGGFLSEDLSWCWWLRSNSVPILVDTSVKVGHVKPTIVAEETYRR